MIYPDGSIAPERTLFPDFDKVDKMKIKKLFLYQEWDIAKILVLLGDKTSIVGE